MKCSRPFSKRGAYTASDNALARNRVWPVTGIFVLLKKCPRIKIFRKFLSHGIKYFVLGQKFSENFCPRTNFFRKFLSYPDKICPTPHRTKIFRITSKIFILGQKFSENFYPRTNFFYLRLFFLKNLVLG